MPAPPPPSPQRSVDRLSRPQPREIARQEARSGQGGWYFGSTDNHSKGWVTAATASMTLQIPAYPGNLEPGTWNLEPGNARGETRCRLRASPDRPSASRRFLSARADPRAPLEGSRLPLSHCLGLVDRTLNAATLDYPNLYARGGTR